MLRRLGEVGVGVGRSEGCVAAKSMTAGWSGAAAAPAGCWTCETAKPAASRYSQTAYPDGRLRCDSAA